MPRQNARKYVQYFTFYVHIFVEMLSCIQDMLSNVYKARGNV